MTHLFTRWRTALRILAIALIVAAIPLPSLAQQPTSQPAQPRLQASIAPVVHAVAKTAPKATTTQEQPAEAKAQLGSKSFFKTPMGMAALAIVFVGAGYAAYSAKNDRIHSVVRQGQ